MFIMLIFKNVFFLPIGTAGIIMAAPSHYDTRQPIDVKYSKVDKKNKIMREMMAAGQNN